LINKIIKLSKNVEETEPSTSTIENEEKHSKLLEKRNEEKSKSYVEVIKGRNHGQQESNMNEYNINTYSNRPTTFKRK
jgi:hypothetical protein